MRVGLSLLTLVPGIVGGSETYVRGLTAALGRVGENDYRVFLPTIAPDAAGGLPATTVTAYRAARSLPGRVGAMSLSALAPWPVRAQLGLGELDVIHFPLSVMLPPVSRPATVTSVLDIQHELLPAFFSKAELAYRRLAYGMTIRGSQRLITISEHARGTLIERFHLDPDLVHAIHLGIDQERFTPAPRERGEFLLYPANRWPHKNHERLFAAFALVRRTRPELRLVLTGALHEGKPVPEGVDVRGRVPFDELVELYRTAGALVFPSLYEGFGMPPLEAMACGCPAAVSTGGSLPEVVGDAARLFDPESVEAIAEAIEDVLARPTEWTARGLERARLFTWDACARAHDAVYALLV